MVHYVNAGFREMIVNSMIILTYNILSQKFLRNFVLRSVLKENFTFQKRF